MEKNNKPKPRKVTVTYDEYLAIEIAYSEMEHTIMSGDLNEEDSKKYNQHFKNLKRLLEKIIGV